MAETPHQYCHACDKLQPVDGHWRALWIHRGVMQLSEPLKAYHFEVLAQTGAVFACGQGSALALVERFLHSGNFDAVQFAPPAAQPLTEISTEQGASRP